MNLCISEAYKFLFVYEKSNQGKNIFEFIHSHVTAIVKHMDALFLCIIFAMLKMNSQQ